VLSGSLGSGVLPRSLLSPCHFIIEQRTATNDL
jgi:hypothetical protein